MTMNIAYDTTSGQDLLKQLLMNVFDNTKRKALDEHREVVKEISVTDYFDRRARIAGLSPSQVEQIEDGQAIPTADPPQPETKDWTQKKHGLAFRITSGMKKFNKVDEMERLTQSLSRSMVEYKDIEIAKMFNNATATTYATGFDSLALASNSHTTLNPTSTYDNYGDALLGYSSLQDGIEYFDKLIDDNGDEMPRSPDKLVTGSKLRFTARELLGTEKKPGTADNDINVIRADWDISPFVYHRITSDTYWSLHAMKDPDYDLFVFTSEEPGLKVQDTTDLTEDTQVYSSQWFVYGVGDPRMFYLGDA